MVAGAVTTDITNPLSFGCASFDGVDDFISFPTNTSLSSDVSFSISIWANMTQFPAIGATPTSSIFGFRPASLRGVGIDVSAAGLITFKMRDASELSLINGITTALNVWHNYICTYDKDSDTMEFFCDGVSQGTTTQTTVLISIANRIGSNQVISGDGNYFNGKIRDFRLYSKVLTSSEVSILSSDSSVTNGLVGLWALSGNANDSINSYNGTVSGTIFVNDVENVAADLAAQRVGATDKYFITEVNGKILSAVIAES